MTNSNGQPKLAERRKEPRYPTHRRICPGIAECGTGFDALILDVSRSGLRMHANRPLPRSTKILLQIDALEVEAEVCYCRDNDDGTFEVGLLIRETGKA